jgi:hypothetical protein
VYGGVPPLAVAVELPHEPAHTELFVTLTNNGDVFKIVTLAEWVQVFASVTVTAYVPAQSPRIPLVVAPLLQLNVYVPMPPVTVA